LGRPEWWLWKRKERKCQETVSESDQLSWRDPAVEDAWRPVRINLVNDESGKIREDVILFSPK
jgi:hypothetical protein